MSGATDHTGIMPGEITAFLTDSTLCIGCKACEVACKEWNEIDADGLNFTGFSYDNTSALGHSTFRRLQALRSRRLPRSLPHRLARSNRIRRGLSSARRLQWLRLLRHLVPLRRRPEE